MKMREVAAVVCGCWINRFQARFVVTGNHADLVTRDDAPHEQVSVDCQEEVSPEREPIIGPMRRAQKAIHLCTETIPGSVVGHAFDERVVGRVLACGLLERRSPMASPRGICCGWKTANRL
jgi:hypothetical protein